MGGRSSVPVMAGTKPGEVAGARKVTGIACTDSTKLIGNAIE